MSNAHHNNFWFGKEDYQALYESFLLAGPVCPSILDLGQ